MRPRKSAQALKMQENFKEYYSSYTPAIASYKLIKSDLVLIIEKQPEGFWLILFSAHGHKLLYFSPELEKLQTIAEVVIKVLGDSWQGFEAWRYN